MGSEEFSPIVVITVCDLVTLSLLGQNSRHVQVKGAKIYLSSQSVEVSVHIQLTPRQSSMAERHLGEAVHGRETRASKQHFCLLSINLYFISLTSLLIGATLPERGLPLSHTGSTPRPIIVLIQYHVPLVLVSHTLDPATSEKPH